MPLLSAHLAAPASTFLLLLLLAASASAVQIACDKVAGCNSAMGYIVPVATTYGHLFVQFNTTVIEDLFSANNLSSNTDYQKAIPAKTTVIIPFICYCRGGGMGQSDQKPIYYFRQGTLDDIAQDEFGGFVTGQEIAVANGMNTDDQKSITPLQPLWIPLPCSCNKVDGFEVTHFAYSVASGDTASQIATKFGVAESTLLSLNGITDGSNLTMGQILDVPLRKVTETGAPAPQTKPGPGANTPEAQSTPGSMVNAKGLHRALRIGGAFLLLVILVIVIWFIIACLKHIHNSDSFMEGAKDLARRFKYHELAVATDNFSKSRELGQGSFGVVYQGELTNEDGKPHPVAVKRLKGSNDETSDFQAELKTISETRHRNLVRLKGWCSRNRSNLIDFMCWWRQKQSVELFLIYELVPNGNLDMHLNQQEQVLPWAIRYNIVKDIGVALRYLHHECNKGNTCILHRDIKTSNILLDEQFNAKLADFGLSRIAHRNNETTNRETLGCDSRSTAVVQTRAIGTAAYMDPNCIKHGIVNFKRQSDVYSFGIVLLEVACTGKSRAHVWDLYKHNPKNMAAAADARLGGNFDASQMQRVALLGLWCSILDGERRPTMVQAMEVLERNATLPDLNTY